MARGMLMNETSPSQKRFENLLDRDGWIGLSNDVPCNVY